MSRLFVCHVTMLVLVHPHMSFIFIFSSGGVTPTTPVKVKGGKNKGAKATKIIERLLSKGHVIEPEEATAFRALSARGNDLAADRPDIGFSANELCR